MKKFLGRLCFLSFLLVICFANIHAKTCVITVDAGVDSGPLEHFWESCGSGHAYLVFNSTQKACYVRAAEELGMKYIRFHGILDDDVGIYNEDSDGNPYYDWTNLDKIYDFILSVGMKPFINLNFLPKLLASTDKISGDCYGYGSWAGLASDAYISPPGDYNKWKNLIYEFVKHCKEKYGAEEIEKWYFEVWNEPNLSPDSYWGGTMDDYYRLYDYAVEGAIKAHPKIKIGGPAFAGGGDNHMEFVTQVRDFLTHCTSENYANPSSNKTRIDFLSYHTYKVGCDVVERHRAAIESLKEFPSLELELFVSEYGQTWVAGEEIIHDENASVFVVSTVDGFLENFVSFHHSATLQYWCISDIFEEHGWTDEFFSPGAYSFGMINNYGVPKPVFNAFKLLHMMGKRLISFETKGRVRGFAASDSNAIQIIIYNDSANEDYELDLRVNNIPFAPCSAEYSCYRVDHNHSNSFTVWKNMDSPLHPTQSQIEEIKTAGELALFEPVSTEQIDGSFRRNLPISPMSITLIVIGARLE